MTAARGLLRPQVVNEWFWVPDRKPGASVRLFCFPHAGGGATTFSDLAAALPSQVELWALRLPGRGSRREHPYPVGFKELVAIVVAHMWEITGQPYAVYGQSFGGLLAYEVSRAFPVGRRPAFTAVASVRPPHHWNGGEAAGQVVSSASLVELSAATPDFLLAEPRLAASALAAVTADLRVCVTYRYQPDPVLAAPLLALVGVSDPLVELRHVAEWAPYARGEFTAEVVPGGHVLARPGVDAALDPLLSLLRQYHGLEEQRCRPKS